MQSEIDRFKDKNAETNLEHTSIPSNKCTQLGDVDSGYSVQEERKFHSIEELHNAENNLSVLKYEPKTMNLNKMSSVSTTCSFKGTDEGSSMVWDEIQYLKLLSGFQGQECSEDISIPSSPKSNEEPNIDKYEKNTFNSNDDSYQDLTKFNNKKVVFTNNKLGHNLKETPKPFDEFTSVCETLTSYTSLFPPKNTQTKFNTVLSSKHNKNDFKVTENLLNLKTNSINIYNNNTLLRKLNKDTTLRMRSDTDSDSSSTVLSTSTANDSSSMDKVSAFVDMTQRRMTSDYQFPQKEKKPRKKYKKTQFSLPEVLPTSLGKYMATLNNYNRNTTKEENEDENNTNKENINKYKHEREMARLVEKLARNDRDLRSGKDWEREDFERSVLENLDRVGGVKYELGSVDLRRKYNSFEQLCFGLGCIVAPTKQELEMCSQLSQLGDESTLSQYETSVYQSCLLRTKSFEGIWKKFCNKTIGIIKKNVLQGIYRLLDIIEGQDLVEPFLKVILLDMGADRQDQHLFLNIVQEEMHPIVKDKFILVTLNSAKSLTLDDIIEQMYIQLCRMSLMMSTGSIDFEEYLSFANVRNGFSDIAFKLEKLKTEAGEENLLEKFIKVFNKNFQNYELVVILDKINAKINDMLYLLQMLGKRKLLPIKCVMVVSSNGQRLENCCNSRIYSNLGIFYCNVVSVPALVDEIIQVVMYDSNVQDFLPNFRMLNEIYELFHFQDFSLTLFVLRIYQLYEQFYNRYIFSYLTTVPSFAFDQGTKNSKENMDEDDKYQQANCFKPNSFKDSSEHSGLSGLLMNTTSCYPDEKNENKTHFEQLLLPKESLTTQKDDLYSPKVSEVSTTTSLKSLLIYGGDKPTNVSFEGNELYKEDELDVDENKDTSYDSFIVDEKDKNNRNKQMEENKNKEEKEDNQEENTNEIGLRSSSKIAETKESNGDDKTPEFDKDKIERDTESNLERLDMAKRIYSIYSLLCISNNMNENHVAYLELKLGLQLDLEKIVLELLPLNSLILFQRRVLFQLGVNLLFKLMVFTPDSFNVRRRLNNLIVSLPTFRSRYDPKIKDERDKPLRELIKRTLKYLLLRSADPAKVKLLKTIINKYNRDYKMFIQVVINIQTFLTWNSYSNFENQNLLKEMNYVLDEDMAPANLVNYIKNKLFMCFFPYVNTYKLSNMLMLQGYMMLFRNEETSGSSTAAGQHSQASTGAQMGDYNGGMYRTKDNKEKGKDGEDKINEEENQQEKEEEKTNGKRGRRKGVKYSREEDQENQYKKKYNKRRNEEDNKEVEDNENENNKEDMERLNDNLELCSNSSAISESGSMMDLMTTNLLSDLVGDSNLDNNRDNNRNNNRNKQMEDNKTKDKKEYKEKQKDNNNNNNRDDSNLGLKHNQNLVDLNLNQNRLLNQDQPQVLSLIQAQNNDFTSDVNYLMYIYRYVKYKMINMWKLFIIYYYLVTTNTAEDSGEKELIEIYIRFNVNIELLEKIYKIILLNPTTNSTISSKETKVLLDNRSDDDDIQLCHLIKNSLSNINVKFM